MLSAKIVQKAVGLVLVKMNSWGAQYHGLVQGPQEE
jgi:hypothetical protein